MVKAIIFDCFGVLCIDGWLPFKEKYFSDDPAKFEEATAFNKRADAGLITYGDFLKGVGDLAGISPEEARKYIENNPPNEKLFEYIRTELKPSYKIGLLSNAAADWLDELFSPGQRALFDATALSFEVGALKPDARAFETIAERLNVSPEECVLVDDQERYCEGAREVGMGCVVYENFKQTKTELEKILERKA